MASLKGLMPRLAPLLATTPMSLYERQRALVGADLLTQTVGKGPGSGVHLTERAVAVLLTSVMATDSLADAPELARRHETFGPTTGKCGLTGASNLVDAISALLENAELRNRLIDLEISRMSEVAFLRYKPHGKTEFRGPSAKQDRMNVSATLSGSQLKRIRFLMQLTKVADLPQKFRAARAREARTATRDRRGS